MTLRLSNMTLQPSSVGAFSKFTFVATAAQTVFTGSDANSNTLAFSNANQLVFLNGVYLREGASHDYVASGGTTITLNSGANLNDVLELFTVDAFDVADAISQSTGDARYLQKTNDLSDVSSASTARTNLGLGTAAVEAKETFQQTSLETQTTTSGTVKSFTSPFTTVVALEVLFNGVSTDGANKPIVRIGPSGGVESTGYRGAVCDAGSGRQAWSTTEIETHRNLATGEAMDGFVRLVLMNSTNDTWCVSGVTNNDAGTPDNADTSGVKSLAGVLNKLDVLIDGADDFDAGEVAVRWYGS